MKIMVQKKEKAPGRGLGLARCGPSAAVPVAAALASGGTRRG